MRNPNVNDYCHDDEGDEDVADYSECVNTFDLEDDGDDGEEDE